MNNIKELNYTQYINYLAILYAFTIPLSRAGIGVFTALFVLLWIMEGKFKEKFALYKNSKVIISLVAFLLFGLFSLLWTENITTSVSLMKRYWYLLVIVVLMFSLQKEYISKVISAFILGVFVSEVIAYGVFFELWHFKHATVENPSPFMQHIEYSIFLAFAALVLLNHIFNFSTLKYKIFYALFFTTVTGNLFLTNGRTGQVAFFIGLLTLAILSFQNKLKALLVSIIVGSIVLTLAYNASNTFKQRVNKGKDDLVNVVKSEDYCSSWGGRVGAWIVSRDIIVNDLILGVGIQDNMDEFHRIIDEKYPAMKCMHVEFCHTHNQYLQVWTSVGLIGLLIFLSIFYHLGKLDIKDKELRHIKYIYLSVFLFAFIPEVMWGRQFSLALSALVFSILLAQYRIEKEENKALL